MKKSDSPSTLRTYRGDSDPTNTDNVTNFDDTPKNVVNVLGGAADRRLPESRSHRHALTTISWVHVITAEAALNILLRGLILKVNSSNSSDAHPGLPGRGEPPSRACN